MHSAATREIRLACADLITSFAHFVDHREFDRAAALFAEDGVFERPDLTARGRDQIAAIWATRPSSVITRHLCQAPYFLEVGIEIACSVTGFMLYHVDHHMEGIPPLGGPRAICEFHDRFRRTADGWRIAHRKSIAILRQSD
ncbi:arginine deiminase [Sphingomonas sp. Root710]|uniref:nuclear transport factor 2 family protein n=1 Tax=Sphingomonas sp. Root710 TaxID=1736594 RepID=UPI0006F72333|nr:nuclear transport factor 2 family protein [Sphingomonas sp. Root710]KRB85550.1 arginine deiminase [Sphingomonas sp. Root710]